jgi:hypothetical protein
MRINDQFDRGKAYLPRGWPPGHERQSYIGIGASGRFYRVDDVGAYPWGERRHADATLMTFDVRRHDRAHWHQIKLFLVWCAQALASGSRDWAKEAYKQLRRDHNASKVKAWDDVLPPAIVEWANRRLAAAAEGESCCDNWRVARVGNTGQVRRYKSQKKAGCCGFADFVETGPDGKRYMLGFNFGH